MPRFTNTSVVTALLVGLPACSLLIDTNPDGVIDKAVTAGSVGIAGRGQVQAGGTATSSNGAVGGGPKATNVSGAGGGASPGTSTGMGGGIGSGTQTDATLGGIGATSSAMANVAGTGGMNLSHSSASGGSSVNGGQPSSATGATALRGGDGGVGGNTTNSGLATTIGGLAGTGGSTTNGMISSTGGVVATGGGASGGASSVMGGSSTGGDATGGEKSCSSDTQCASGHCVSGTCCSTACGVCNSCGTGSCLPVTNGTTCGDGQVCSGGTCQTGCWIAGGFRASGETSGNCKICDPTRSSTDWSNNDGVSVTCGSCGGSATCTNKELGPCSKEITTYWQDHDGDGYGNSRVASTNACSAPAGFVANAGDCDDSDDQWYPGRNRCDVYDANAQTKCSNDGTESTTSCSDGCAGGQCRNFATFSTAGSVTCGTLTCSTTDGCSFIAPINRPPTCGTTAANWYEMCDGPNDCPSGQVCCHNSPAGNSGESTVCVASGSCPWGPSPGGSGRLVCDTPGSVCPSGGTCKMAASFLSIYECQ